VLRNLIEDWFFAFPESADKKDLRGRFRSKNNEHHLGALFELLNFVIFRKLGFIGNSHPEIQNEKSSSVDFLFSNSKKEFYLEANTTVGDSDKGLSPYIISLNCLENFNIKEELLFEILYGQEVITHDFENDQTKSEIKKDGFFNDNFYNDRVSGLLFFPNVNAFSMLFREPVYVINPIANKILSLDVPFTIYEGVASNIKRSETGKLIYEILDIDKEEIAKHFPQF